MLKGRDRLNLDDYPNRLVGKALLNVYHYRKARAESADPTLIGLAIDTERAVQNANLTDMERIIIDTHYNIIGGDSILGDHFGNRQVATAEYLDIHPNTVNNRLDSAWEKIGKSYKGG